MNWFEKIQTGAKIKPQQLQGSVPLWGKAAFEKEQATDGSHSQCLQCNYGAINMIQLWHSTLNNG